MSASGIPRQHEFIYHDYTSTFLAYPSHPFNCRGVNLRTLLPRDRPYRGKIKYENGKPFSTCFQETGII